MNNVARLERKYKACMAVLGFCVAGLFAVIIIDGLEEPDRKAEYLELCADDGFKQSECLYRWGVMR